MAGSDVSEAYSFVIANALYKGPSSGEVPARTFGCDLDAIVMF